MKLVLLLVLCLCACKKPQAEDTSLEKGATVRLKDFSRKSFTIDGKEEWDLTAGEAYVFRKAESESKIVAYRIDLQQFDNGKKTGRLKAERGEIDYKNKVLHLTGNVSFIDPERNISSDKLTYQMETKVLESDASVLLIEAGTTTHCRRGITVNRETNVQICRAPAVVRITRSGDSKGFQDL
ncbi:MAG: LPS export ABC transporter periplasmic protein LptC [Leptospirales bacterium]|nr:LPS export ABC transporter periplasmic protein LptC [Leptospirales bacterium]